MQEKGLHCGVLLSLAGHLALHILNNMEDKVDIDFSPATLVCVFSDKASCAVGTNLTNTFRVDEKAGEILSHE